MQFIGGSIYMHSCNNLIYHSNFTKNIAHLNGASIVIDSINSSIHKIFNCYFIQNNAGNGGAIWIPGGYTIIKNCLFMNNTADYGALQISDNDRWSINVLI